VLLVTHDRELIEKSCNRYWLIKDGELTEWHDLEKLYGEIDSETKAHDPEFSDIELLKSGLTNSGSSPTPNQTGDNLDSEEAILERLYQLETLIEDDKQRKPKHQKPKMQQQWLKELDQITHQLNL
jgi:ABC-type multidrug transport system ATPase subunit